MQEVPHAGGPSAEARAATGPRLFATFKLAAPYVEIVQKREGAGAARPAANVNRIGLVNPGRP